MAFDFPSVSPPSGVLKTQWQDWKWQLRFSLRGRADYERYFSLTPEEETGFALSPFAVGSTPYYARLAATSQALRRIILPLSQEKAGFKEGEMEDPLGEVHHSPVSRLVHRYPDRVLLLVTDSCPIYCRYCTRKRFVAKGGGRIRQVEYEAALAYIQKNKGIKEVILSGGDPLTLSDRVLGGILSDLRAFSHVEIIRIGSRVPAVLPQRITHSLVGQIKKHQPVFVMSHFNHPDEISLEAARALSFLADGGIPVFNQMVLIREVNDHPAVVAALSRRLLFLRARPYYMFQCDPSPGTNHLKTSLASSRALQRELWGRLSGLALPRLALDLPGGGGKVELVPESFVKSKNGQHTFKGWDGKKLAYTDPLSVSEKKPKSLLKPCYIKEWEEIKNQSYGNKRD